MPQEIAMLASVFGQVPGLLDEFRKHFTVHLMNKPELFDPEAARRVRAIATSGGVGADASVYDRFPAAEIVASFGVGYDQVDVAEAERRGLKVTNTPGVLTEDVADLAIALLLAVSRDIVVGDAHARSGDWAAKGPMPLKRKVSGKRAGIVGLGGIGQDIARRAAAFNMDIAWTGPRPKPDQPYEYVPDPVALAERSDVLFVSCVGGPETRHLVNTQVLKALGPEGILVNVSRGSVVDEDALIAALRADGLYGAGLDVFENEPEIPQALKDDRRVVLHPHHASGTTETRRAMGLLVLDNLRAHFDGRPLPTPVVG
ncbi:2-hydroxyacid dehydrogenase [Kaustia mangrovi]|uniref:2-hydroxyacid dehydrogenase n=1 Tax=Kaustia mangrovi TaxID=2593653 RepID=A0A7S8C2Z4_9HYPH|nr:2-hydroxyacid dehydrogenase [Kaustia mangrovi]QPC42410.1 2-hydroxyacid dehydrogenase [Kaustia mangrovi]